MQAKDIKPDWFALVKEQPDLARAHVIFQCRSRMEAIHASRYYWFRLRVCVVTKIGDVVTEVWNMNAYAILEREERDGFKRRRKDTRARARACVES